MRPRSARLVLLLASTLVVGAAACSSSDGRRLPPPDPRITTTSVSTPVVGQPSDDEGVTEVFSLASPAFGEGQPIPVQHTCTGADISPPLQWASTPPEALELALVVKDRDAGDFVHWVVTGIDPTVQGFAEGGIPETALEAANDAGSTGWTGPCPPAGSGTHTYVFTLHVLNEPLAMPPGVSATQAAQEVEGASVASATLTGTFTIDP